MSKTVSLPSADVLSIEKPRGTKVAAPRNFRHLELTRLTRALAGGRGTVSPRA